MDRRFDGRLQEMLAQAEVSPELTEGCCRAWRPSSSRSRHRWPNPSNGGTPSST